MLSLVAEYPLGTYAGRTRDATPEQFPTPDRLLAALLAAAGSGAHAQLIDGQLAPRPQDIELLEWLESHPPDIIQLPALAASNSTAVAYRKQGVTGNKGLAPPESGPAAMRTALDGAVTWQWRNFPERLRPTLNELASEVAYIGPAESPTVVTIRDEAPPGSDRLLIRDESPDPFSPHAGTLELQVPRAGRTRALVNQLAKRLHHPSAAADKVKKQEGQLIDEWLSTHLGSEIYRDKEQVASDLPWSEVHVLQVSPTQPSLRLTMADAVRIAVATHRAIVGILGAGGAHVDSWVTGRFLEGVPRPANRLAIHYLLRTSDASIDWHPDAKAAILIMQPHTLPGDVRDSVVSALRTLTRNGLNVTRREGLKVLSVSRQPCATFWNPAREALTRLWSPAPVAIVERRRRRATLTDAMLASVGMVWRDLREGDPGEWVQVLRAQKLSGPGLDRFVHRMNPEAALVAYRALADFTELMPDRALVAIGQSRHLGTGLLVPVDLTSGERKALNDADR